MSRPSEDDPFVPGTYGRSFADVYDRWYPVDETSAAAVRRISSLAGPGGGVLELGVGTGRLAIPLATAGHPVHGMDASAEMLEVLRSKASGDLAIVAVLGDAGDALDWPEGPYDVVVAAFNLMFNLAEPAAQEGCFRAAAGVLAEGGALVVETFLPASIEQDERRLEVKEVSVERVVLIATDSAAGTGVVTGQHIELVDGEPVRLRPWRIRVVGLDELDALAAAAGLRLEERHGDWAGAEFDPQGAAHVSVYRRA
jgi:SAM-dependent methyltransferase